MQLRIGTRGSPLALAQSRWVEQRLKSIEPELQIEMIIIRTSGDLFQDQSMQAAHLASLGPMGTKGLFVKEIEEALLKAEIDLAVHSAKDMPAKIPEGLHVLAYPEREDPRDVFIGRNKIAWKDLGAGHKIGTSSLRRQIQAKLAKPGIETIALRGNVDTRLNKLDEKILDGIILAASGLSRLGREIASAEPISTDTMVPAPGQGALAIESRKKDDLRLFSQVLDHGPTRIAVEWEREFLRLVGGGCSTPLGAYAEIKPKGIEMSVFWAKEDGSQVRSQKALCQDTSQRDSFLEGLALQVALQDKN
jgi:hydroxymethylbilane synthase